jgi:hypothetical protein
MTIVLVCQSWYKGQQVRSTQILPEIGALCSRYGFDKNQ